MKGLIKPDLTITNGKKELKQLNLTPKLHEYFVANKLCDVTVQVGDQKILAHKVVLATSSTIWRDLFFENEFLSKILIEDFDYETIKDLIEYIYTGNMKKVTDQLLIAADKYEVSELKKLCEEHLIETIDLDSVINLLVLADCYKATSLYEKVAAYIQEHTAAFMNLEDTNAMFMMYPQLAFKLFKRIS